MSHTVSRATFVDGASSSGRRPPRARGKLSPPASCARAQAQRPRTTRYVPRSRRWLTSDEDREEFDHSDRSAGRPVASRREEEIPSLEVVKTFFEAFYIGREHTTPNTQQPGRQPMCCVTANSVFKLFAIVFNVCTIGGSESGAFTAQNFGRVWLHPHRLPTGTKFYRQIVSILGRKRRRRAPKSNARCSRVEDSSPLKKSSERALGSSWRCRFMFSPENLPKSLQTQAYILAARRKPRAQKLKKECISEHLRHALGTRPGREPREERAMSWPTPTLRRQPVASSAESPARSLTTTLRTSGCAQNTCPTKWTRTRIPPTSIRARRRLQDVAGATNTRNAPRAHQTSECVPN